MEIFKTIPDIRGHLDELEGKGNSIGFVPTMGALHKGHISLLERANLENDKVVCSIFVNPIQFNNKEDLKKYPRTLEADVLMLKENNCDVLFAPDNDVMYPEPDNTIFDFGNLDKILEGKFRPGHFNGVAVVVRKLFDIIKPGKAYFGEKDYQQLAVIKALVNMLNLTVEIVPCPTVREQDGLALSSRNLRLDEDERAVAPEIFRILSVIKDLAVTSKPAELKNWLDSEFLKYPEFKVEYFEIADPDTLSEVTNPAKGQRCIALIAVYLGVVRLIDNIEIIF